ncbi:MAG: starch-binding protein [Erysipelotrichaceae bacterium]|nr:starch-binding protein [Erysipelotrichaceae bacterium]
MGKGRAKIPFWLLIVFSAVTIFTTAISTLAWFTLYAPPSSSMVAGSSDVEIEGVTGYKIKETRKPNGYVDYSQENRIVSQQDLTTNEFTTKENTNKQGFELDFDVPPDGIGYYVVVPNSLGTYKISVDDKNYAKFSAYEHGSAYSAEIFVSEGEAFRIRSYQMKDYETNLTTMTITNSTCNGATIHEGKEVTPDHEGYYRVWIDTTTANDVTTCTVGLELLSKTSPNAGLGRKITRNSLNNKGGQRIWLNLNGQGWRNDSAHIVLDVYDSGGHSWTEMTRNGETDYYYADVPSNASGWSKMIFVRAKSTWSSSAGADFNGYKWNQTGDLDFPDDPKNCYKLTAYESGEWEEYQSARIKVGSNAYANMTWDDTNSEWNYTISGSVASGTALTFEKYGESISITRSADGSDLPYINNLSVSGTTYKIVTGGSNLKIYLHTDNSVWVTTVETAKVSIGGATAQTMTYEDVNSGQWHYSASNVADNATLAFTFSGVSITVSKSPDSSAKWYEKNNFSSNKVIRGNQGLTGGGNIEIYLHKDKTVWVSAVAEIQSGSKGWYALTQNPNNENELQATGMSVSAKDTVALRVNGSTVTYTVNSAAYNNISGTSILKDAENVGMFITKDTTKSLWVEGNKTYALSIGGVSKGEMAYQSASSVHPGWYGLTNISATADTLSITLNGAPVTGLISASGEGVVDNNFNASTGKVRKDGTVSVYFDTSTKAVHVTPIYSITVGSTNLIAELDSGSYKATFSSFADDASVKAFINDQEQTTYTAEGSRDAGATRNNCYGLAGALKTLNGVDTNTVVSFNKSAGTIWVDGYAPTYWIKVGSAEYIKLTEDESNSSIYKANITAAAGDTILFRRNSSGTAFNNDVTPEAPTNLNNINASHVVNTAVEDATLRLNIDTNQVWLSGKEITLKFYDPATSIYIHLWNSSNTSVRNAAFPGEIMTNTGNNVHAYTFTVGNTPWDSVLFSTGNMGRQTVDISLASDLYEGKCIAFGRFNDTDSSKYDIRSFSESSLPNVARVYLLDKGSTYFGGTPQLYAWNGDANNAAFPGTPMNEIIPGVLWGGVVNTDTYANVLISAKASGDCNQTADQTIAATEDKVFVASGTSGHTVTGNWAAKVTEATVPAVAYVNSTGTTMAIGNWKTGDGSDQGRNKYIYERGIQAANGDTLSVKINDVAVTSFVSAMNSYPYLTITGSTIKVKLGEGESARFNFYINDKDELAIIMVPDRGNGFYIMPYSNSAVGFIGAHKMSSANNTTALYDGYYAEKNSKIYIRSYIDSKDKIYPLADSVDANIATVAGTVNVKGEEIGAIIELQKSSYYTINVSAGKVYITEFTMDEFLKMNSLDQYNRTVSSQTDIFNQLTSMVLAVKFKPTSNKFAMSPQVLVKNDAANYLGVAAAFVTESAAENLNPYEYMRASARYTYNETTNPNGLTKRGTDFTLQDASFATAVGGTGSYYAFILVDYVYSASLSGIAYNYSENINLFLRLAQVS